MNRLNVCIIFGGQSSEHEVSRNSAYNVISYADREKYVIHLIGITKQGRWLYFNGDIEKIKSDEWENDSSVRTAFISPDASIGGIVFPEKACYQNIKIDVAIPMLHGKLGEDGTIQGLFELSKIPYVGPGVCASANAMDKVISKTLLDSAGITQAPWLWFDIRDYKDNLFEIVDKIESTFSYNLFVKPANAGSSVGISKVRNRSELISAIEYASIHDYKIIIEKEIKGQEIECAVLGNRHPLASTCGEIIPAKEFYDYEAKYLNADSKTLIPARIDDSKMKEIQNIALNTYRILGCEGMSRVDFFVENGTQKVILNELNTIPGFTNISMYPKMMEFSGVSYPKLIDELIKYALERSRGVNN